MKIINRLNAIILMAALSMICTSMQAAQPPLDANQFFNDMEAFYESLNYPSTGAAVMAHNKYLAAIDQVNDGITAKSAADVVAGLKTAATIAPEDTMLNLLDGQALSYQNLTTVFSTAEMQQIALAAGLTPSQATLYANKGISDSNFENALQLIDEGIQSGNLSSVLSGLNIVNTEAASDPMVATLKSLIADPSSNLNDQIISNFSSSQVKQICTAAQIDPADATAIYNSSQFFQAGIKQLPAAFEAGDVASMTNILSVMKSVKPTLTAELFQNGEPLDYATLSAKFSNIQDLSSIASSGGLQTADIVQYVSGSYTGTSGGSDPASGGINTGTGGAPSGGDSVYQQQLEYTVNLVKSEGMATAISVLNQTKTSIQQLEAQLATAKQSESTDVEDLETELASEQSHLQVLGDAIDLVNGEAGEVV